MDSGLYAAYTALLSRTQALDTAANNLANVGTGGFRAEKGLFRGVLVDNLGGLEGDSQVGSSVNDFGVLGGNALDFSQGQMTETGNPLDLGLQGDGFFRASDATWCALHARWQLFAVNDRRIAGCRG